MGCMLGSPASRPFCRCSQVFGPVWDLHKRVEYMTAEETPCAIGVSLRPASGSYAGRGIAPQVFLPDSASLLVINVPKPGCLGPSAVFRQAQTRQNKLRLPDIYLDSRRQGLSIVDNQPQLVRAGLHFGRHVKKKESLN